MQTYTFTNSKFVLNKRELINPWIEFYQQVKYFI